MKHNILIKRIIITSMFAISGGMVGLIGCSNKLAPTDLDYNDRIEYLRQENNINLQDDMGVVLRKYIYEYSDGSEEYVIMVDYSYNNDPNYIKTFYVKQGYYFSVDVGDNFKYNTEYVEDVVDNEALNEIEEKSE